MMTDKEAWRQAIEDNESSANATYWALLAIGIFAPVLLFLILVIKSPLLWQLLRSPLRYRSYGLRRLERHGEQRLCPVYILLYRHRPLLMDLCKVAVEFAFMAHFFVTYAGEVSIRVPIITWCVYDVMVVAFLYNLVELKRRYNGHGVRMAFWIYACYSIAFGFPMGTATKVLWVFYSMDRILFHFILTPYYFGCMTLIGVALFYLIPVGCMKSNSAGKANRAGFLTLFFFAISLFCAWQFLLVEFCQLPAFLTELDTWFEMGKPCAPALNTHTSAFLPISTFTIILQFVFTWFAINSGLLWRFLPEVCTLWSASIAFITAMYYQDRQDSRILFAAILALIISAFITLLSNLTLVYVIFYTVRYAIPLREQQIAQGRRSRHFNEEQKRKNKETRERLLENFMQRTGRSEPTEETPDGKNTKRKARHKQHRKPLTLKGTLFSRLWIHSRDQMSRCCICFEDYTGDKDAIVIAIIKKCGHYFHYDCVWDWLEKRPTCPMCRQAVDLDETGLRVLSYYEIKHSIQKQKPDDAIESDDQSDESSDFEIDIDMTPKVTDQKKTTETPEVMQENSIRNQDTDENIGDSNGIQIEEESLGRPEVFESGSETAIHPSPLTRSDAPSQNRERPRSDPSKEARLDRTSQLTDSPESKGQGHAVELQDSQPSKPNKRLRRTHSHELIGSEQLVTEAGPSYPEVRVRSNQTSGPSGEHRQQQQSGQARTKRHRSVSESHTTTESNGGLPAHLPQFRRPSYVRYNSRENYNPPVGALPKTKDISQFLKRKQEQASSSTTRSTSAPITHLNRIGGATPPGILKDIRDKRVSKRMVQSRRRCEICRKRYEGDSRDIVVSFIPDCGHFYHCWCLDTYARANHCCPRCHFAGSELRSLPPSAAETPDTRSTSLKFLERKINLTEIHFAFLNDVLQDATERSQNTSPAHSLRGESTGGNNRPYIVEMERF